MKRLAKRMVALVVAVSMLLASATGVHANEAEGPTVHPLRAVLEDAGAFVEWVNGLAVIVMPNGDEWTFTPGAETATLNSEAVPLNVPVVVVNGVSFISYADLAALFGIDAQAHEAAADLTPLGELAMTTKTATETASAFMEIAGVTGLTMAIVDVETGFTWTQGFGYADSVNGVPVDGHTLFQIGSVSKPFTAVAVMQLVERGYIDLDSPLVYYIPEFSMLPSPVLGGDSDDVTVRMLLSNTSGVVGDHLYGWLITGEEQYHGHMNNLLQWLPTRELVFPPGMAYDYSNNNWTLLSILVARVMGYENYFEGFVAHANENIFVPLGMERSTFEFTSELTNVAMPYISLGMQDVMHTVSPIGAGGVFSSAYEMALFMHEIGGDGDTLLAQETIAYMMREHAVMVPDIASYGLGFVNLTIGELEVVGHDGAITHYHSQMIINTETGLGVFVSTNTVSGILIAAPLAFAVMEAAIAEKTGVAPMLQAEPASDTDAYTLSEEALEALAQFVGLYSFDDQGIWELEITDGVLTWRSGEIAFELTPLPDGTFDSIAGNYSFELVDGEAVATLTAGDVQMLGVRIDGAEEIAPPEGFIDWVGIYNFVPRVENETGIIMQIIVAINEHGAPVITIVQPIHTYLGTSEAPLFEYNGYWFVATMPVRFFVDDDGNRSIDLLGGLYVMQ